MSDSKEDVPKKKGKMGKIVVLAAGFLILVGGGAGAGLYAARSGMVGGGAHEPDNSPKLIPKSEQKRAGGEGEGHEGKAEATNEPPLGKGGDPYASNYYAMDKDFTSNLNNSSHFIQVGIAVSTPYDDRVIQNLKTNDIAVRSAILLALGDTTDEQVFTSAGKKQLQARLVSAINGTLKQKEGFGGISNVYFTNFVVQ
jgi:flagellar FliL protein